MEFMKAFFVAMERGRTELSSLSYQAEAISTIRFGRPFKEQFAIGMGGNDRPVARKSKSEGLVQAIHGIGGKHARTRAAGRAGTTLNSVYLLVTYLRVASEHHRVDQVVSLVTVNSSFHWATRDKDSGDIKAHSSHQHAGGNLVTVTDADHGIDGMGIAHVFNAVGDQVAGWQGVEHPGMAHGDTIINGDCVELGGKATRFGDNFFEMLTDFMEMDVARDELGE